MEVIIINTKKLKAITDEDTSGKHTKENIDLSLCVDRFMLYDLKRLGFLFLSHNKKLKDYGDKIRI